MLRFHEHQFEAALRGERPVAATYFTSVEAASQNTLPSAIRCLAEAFFSQFGIGGKP